MLKLYLIFCFSTFSVSPMGIGSPGHPRNRGKPIMSAACLGQELMQNGDAIAAATQTTLVTIIVRKLKSH